MELNEQIIKLDSITKGSLLYELAKAKIKHCGEYTCTYKGINTRIII